MVILLVEFDGLYPWAIDIGNAYLEANTKDKVYIDARDDFGDKEDHIMVIHKVLYGLRSSGLIWYERLADYLRGYWVSLCKTEHNVWTRERNSLYEYITVYINNLDILTKHPNGVICTIPNKYKFKLKDTGLIKHYVWYDHFGDKNGKLCFSPAKYIENMIK